MANVLKYTRTLSRTLNGGMSNVHLRMMSSAVRPSGDAFTADGRRRVTVAYGDGIGPEVSVFAVIARAL